MIIIETLPSITEQACWPNGKALDYESRDCRFDPCVGHIPQLSSSTDDENSPFQSFVVGGPYHDNRPPSGGLAAF